MKSGPPNTRPGDFASARVCSLLPALALRTQYRRTKGQGSRNVNKMMQGPSLRGTLLCGGTELPGIASHAIQSIQRFKAH